MQKSDSDKAKQELSAEISRLRRKPYNEAHENIARERVSRLADGPRKALKYILHSPDCEVALIPGGAKAASDCYEQGVLDRREFRPGNQLMAFETYYTVKPSFRDVLEDILYPNDSRVPEE